MAFEAELSKEELQAIAKRGLADPPWFLRTFLSKWFPGPIPWVHLGLLAILTRRTGFLEGHPDLPLIVKNFVWREDPADEKSLTHPMFRVQENGSIELCITRFTLIMMPRGFSKTTLCNGVVIWAACYQLVSYLMYISETSTHAEIQLKNVKNQLENNPLLIKVFGTFRPPERQGKKWAEDLIECMNGFKAAAKGRGSQIRGSNIDAERPDLIICDDLEDKESVKTKDQRDKTLSWFLSDVTPALPEIGEAYERSGLVMLGTLLNSEALLANLAKDPEFTTVVFGATLEGDVPLWPANMTVEKLARKRAFFARQGKLSEFYMEYYNRVRNEDGAKFKPSYIIIPQDFDPSIYIHRALALDPAISEAKDADFCSFGVVGMSARGRYAVLENISRRGMSPREQVDMYFQLALRWRPTYHGVEAQAFQQALVHLLREEMFRKKQYFEIQEIRHRTAKVPRVEGILQPRYAAGYIVHARHFAELETCLLDWPNGKKDPADVTAMCIALLDPYAAQAYDPEKDMAEDEYEEDAMEYASFYSAP